jgi:hypothetical protein
MSIMNFVGHKGKQAENFEFLTVKGVGVGFFFGPFIELIYDTLI